MEYKILYFSVFLLLGCAYGESLNEVLTDLQGNLIATAEDSILVPIVGMVSYKCPVLKDLLVFNKTANVEKLSFVYKNLENPDDSKRISLEDAVETVTSITKANPEDTLVVIVHGWTDSPQKDTFDGIVSAFNKIGRYNILSLDATEILVLNYFQTVSYTHNTGVVLGEILSEIIQGGVDPKSIHLIGQSVGAHIAGIAGKTVYNTLGIKLGRITGLDPVGMCFTNVNTEERLYSTDADFVDVVDTDIDLLGSSAKQIGHVNFYPNGGKDQAGCVTFGCDHARSILYFAESISNPTGFLAVQCNSFDNFTAGSCSSKTSYMGHYVDQETRGAYYLQTAENPPYCLGPAGIVYKAQDKGRKERSFESIRRALEYAYNSVIHFFATVL